MKTILKQLRKADEDYHLIEDNDVLLIGVSGGKDSMLLLKALSIYQHFDHKNFKIIAVHMKMGFPNMDSSIIADFSKELCIPYYEKEVPIYSILKHYLKEDNTIDCSRCSSLKRGAIVNIAKELKANKIVFAHHGDDAIETFMLNAIYGGKIATFAPKIHYENNDITFIRPLIYTHEQDIIKTVKKEKIKILSSTCPKDGNSKRSEIKKLIYNLYQQYPTSKHNLLKMLSNEDIKLWKKDK